MIIGAGAAGIAAARALIARRFEVVIVEAAGRIGGRAYTESTIFGAPYDHGCASLQGPRALPHVGLAHQLGFTLHDHASAGDVLFVGNRRATLAEQDARAQAWNRITTALNSAKDDVAAAEVTVRGDPMAALVETWIGPMDFGVDFDALSTRDWNADADADAGHDHDYLVKQGLGTLVARLGDGLPIAFNCAATALDWSGAGVTVETSRGSIAARACIVTVSTGVLASGAIRFTPGLPDWKAAAIAAVPMGCLAKIGLRFDGARFGLSANDYLSYTPENRVSAAACYFLTFPTDHDYVVGYVGGCFGRDLACAGPAAAIDFALAEFERMVGSTARRHFVSGHLSEWESNPLTRGAYAAARPGQSAARADLARPLGDRLFFAGEAMAYPHFALCSGAHISGEHTAADVAAKLSEM
ncbi:NAD(P)/FAD-dependent oxidoreductase [Sandarakinorhabdus sp.]|uniref:flavin monoamine oxidase family protein n=1 Tax=Sandarakinorhabdus sp. TaxID=1916663 RepID=UPI003340559D